MIAAALEGWAEFCARRSGIVLAVIAAVCALSAIYAAREARIDSDLSRLIRPSDSLEWYAHDRAFNAAFANIQNTAAVVISGRDFSLVRDHARTLRDALRSETDIEAVYAPSLAEVIEAGRALFIPPADLERWLEGVEYGYGPMLRLTEGADVGAALSILVDHLAANPRQPLPRPLETLLDAIVSSASDRVALDRITLDRIALEIAPPLEPDLDGEHHEVLVVRGRQRLDESLPHAAHVELLRRVRAAHPPPADVRVRLTGEAKLADEEIRAAFSGIELAGTLSLLVLAAVLGFGVRSWRAIATIFALLTSGVLLTLGWATLAVGSFNTLSLIFVVMFFGLGVDFAVHFALRAGETDTAGRTAGPAVAARDIGGALLLCATTSGIAFLAFAPTAYRGLGELGVISAGGMAIAVVLALTLIPALQGHFGTPPTPPGRRTPASSQRFGWVIGGAVVVALLASTLARDLRFDYSVLAMRDASTEGMATLLDLQRAGIATDYSIAVLADDAREAAEISERLRALPEVADVTGPDVLVPDAQDAKLDRMRDTLALFEDLPPPAPGTMQEFVPLLLDDLAAAQSAVPDKARAAVASALTTLRSLNNSQLGAIDARLPDSVGESLETLARLLAPTPWTLETLPRDVTALMVTADGRRLLRVQPAEALDSRDATQRFVDAIATVAPNYAGRTVVEWGVGGVVVEAFAHAAALALAGIALVLAVYFRGLLLPALVLVPIALSMLITAAVMQLTGITLNMANILVVPLIVGLGVDTGIHVVDRWRHSDDLTALAASSTPRAVLISGLTTLGTFASLSLSPHGGAASIGLLLTIAIGTMLVVTFGLLPALLEVCGRWTRKARRAA